jgi:hypothetical protein
MKLIKGMVFISDVEKWKITQKSMQILHNDYKDTGYDTYCKSYVMILQIEFNQTLH